MAKESLALDRFPAFYWNASVAANADLPTARGGAAGAYNVNRAAGNVRLFGSINPAAAPAAGFPRVRFWANPGNILANTQVDLYTPTVDAFGAYPIDTPLLTPYYTIEYTQGGAPGNVAGEVWVVPESGGGSSSSSGGGSPTTPIYTKDGTLTDLGYVQGTVTNVAQSITALFGAPPATALYLQLTVDPGAVTIRYRSDGTSPTATAGNPIAALQIVTIEVSPLSNLQFISTGANSVLNGNYYK